MGGHYILFTSLWKMYPKKSTIFLIWVVNFQNCDAIKKSHYGFKAYPYPNILIPSANRTINVSILKFFFLNLMQKKKGGGKLVLPPSTFQSGEGDCPQLLCPWSGISEVRTADTYRASEFMSVRSFSGVWVAQSSVFCVTVFIIFWQPLNICLFVLLYLYIYIIYC
jgi:hypothetical protein